VRRLGAKHCAPNGLTLYCIYLAYMDIRSSLEVIYSVIYCRYSIKYIRWEEDELVKQRILLVSLVGFLIFALLLGGKVIYQKEWVDVSIMQQSQQIPGVISAKVIKIKGVKELDVATNKMTNLRQASLSLQKLDVTLPIRFLDQNNDDLKIILGQMQFALQEGLALGDFTGMEQKVRIQAENAGIQLELQIDSDALYVVLNQGDAQLVEVIERDGNVNYLPTVKQ